MKNNYLSLVFNLIFGRFFASLIALMSRSVLTFICTPILFGAIVSASTSIALFVRMISSGVGQSSQHFSAKSIDGKYDASLIFSYLPVITFSIFVSIYFNEINNYFFEGESIGYVLDILKYSLSFNVVHFVVLLFFVGKNKVKIVNALTLIPVVFTFFLYLVVWLFSLSSEYILYSIVLASFFGAAFSVFYIVRCNVNFSYLSIVNVKEIFQHSASVTPVTTLAYFSSNSVLIVGGYIIGFDSVAIFAVANIFVEILTQIYGPINMFAFNKFVQKAEVENGFEQLAKASRLLFFLMLVISIFLLPIGALIINLFFSADYSQAILLLPYMLLAGVFLSIQKLFESYLYAIEKHRFISLAQLLYIFPVFFVMPFIHSYSGESTLAVTFLMSAVCSFVTVFLYILRISGLSWFSYLVVKRGDVIFLFEILSKYEKFNIAVKWFYKFFTRR